MSWLLGAGVGAAYHIVSALSAFLAPLPAGAAAAIVVFTMAVRLVLLPLSFHAMRGQNAQARLAPQIQQLRRRYSRAPDKLQREIAALYQREGVSALSGCLPMLLQAPFLSVLYLLFRSRTIDGAPNALLARHLFGAQLGSHYLGGAGPFSGPGVVFLALFALLAVIGWLHARLARRAPAFPAATSQPTGAGRPAATSQPTARGKPGTAWGPGAVGALARVAPFLTVAVAAFMPLATGLYLATTAAWTLAERAVFRRRLPG